MAWDVTVSKEERADGSKVVTLTYSDGQRIVKEAFDVQGNIDDAYLKSRAKSKIDWLTAQDTSFASISEGVLAVMADVPVTPPDPKPEEVARKKFTEDLALLNRMNRAIALGFMTADDQTYKAQKELVQSEFVLDYLEFI